MKKIVSFLIICFLFLSVKAQYPISQNIGAPTTLVVAKGGLKADSTFIVPTFTDTSKANLSNYIKVYPGALIRVQDTLYMRNKTATQWLAAGTIGGAIDSLKRSSDSIYAHKYGQWVFQYKDSTGGSVVIPTLQQVTDAGNTTINSIDLTGSTFGGNTLYNFDTNEYDVKHNILEYYTNSLFGLVPNVTLKGDDNYGNSELDLYSHDLGNTKYIKIIPSELGTKYSNGASDYKVLVDPSTLNNGENTYYPIPNDVNDTIATLADVRNNTLGGTVTSVATGYGLSGGTITTSGTLVVDTATLSTKYLRIVDTTNKWVNSITRTSGKDSIIYYIGSNRYAIKDSVGNGILSGTASGTDTYTATISGVSSYVDGNAYLINFTNGNTTGSTLNINSLGAKTLYRNNDGAIIGGDIWAGGEMLCVYNSTLNGFQVIGISPNSLYAYVTNVDSATITKGQVVYVYGGTGDRMTVKLAKNTGDPTSAQTVGVVLSTSIGVNQKGFIITQGLLDGLSILPTSTYADGDALYLGSTAGSITKVKPSAPSHLVYLGNVTTASNGSAGRWYVRVQNGYELEELHNVAISSPQNNQVLAYSDTQQLWKNRNIYSIVDTTTTIATKSNLALKLNISDTATMLSPYVNTAGYGLSKSGQTLSADTSKLSTLYQTNLRVKYTDTASMLLPYLRKIDTTNKFVNTITRTAGKDSIIFYIGGTRYAIKDSTGGGAAAAGSTGYVQFNNAGSFAADSSHFWDNTNKRLGIGTTTPTSLIHATGSVTASSSIARGFNFTPTLVAAANNDTLNALDINPTFTNGAYTGIKNYVLKLSNSIGISTDNNYGINYLNFNSLTNGQAISANFSPNGTPTGYSYVFQFNKSSTGSNSSNLLFVGSGSSGTSGTANRHTIAVGNSNNNSNSLCFRVAPTNNDWDVGNNQLTIFPTGNVVIQNSSQTATDAGYRLDVNGTARIQGNLTQGNNFILGDPALAHYSQIKVCQEVSATSKIYRTTNAGSNITPKLAAGNGSTSVGNIMGTIDGTNGYVLTACNNGNLFIARAGINITNLNNTAGSESADMIFLTQSGGTAMSEKMRITSGGGITYTATNTAAGTTGNQTINKPSGTVNIAAAGTSITVTNSLVTANSIVFATIRTNDATATIKNVVPSAGSFTINLNAAATAETSIGFFVIN